MPAAFDWLGVGDVALERPQDRSATRALGGTAARLTAHAAVRGLTTAATIWATAAIGMAAGTARYFEAAFTTLLILAVLMVLKPVERRFFKRPHEAQISVVIPRTNGEMERVRAALAQIGTAPVSVRIHELSETEDRLEMEVAMPSERTTSDLLRVLRTIEGARQVLISRDLIEDRVRAGN